MMRLGEITGFVHCGRDGTVVDRIRLDGGPAPTPVADAPGAAFGATVRPPDPAFIAAFREAVARAAASEYPAARYRGRGIVICAGGWSMLPGAYVTASLLRWDAINSRLPIEVWGIGERGELDPIFADLTRHLNVTWRDASAELRRLGVERREPLRGWAIKPLALSLSAFEQVMMLDADCYPVYDPERLMDDPVVAAKGAAFWPDNPGNVGGVPLSADRWAMFGMPPPVQPVPGFESGQLYADKRRHWAAVELLAWLSDRFDDFDETRGGGGGLHGDKDVFSVAFRAADSAYWMAPPVRHHEVAFLQHDRKEHVFTVHRCQDKLRLAHGTFRHTPQHFEHTNFRSTTLPHEHMVHRFLTELRDRLRPDVPGYRDGTQDEQIWREVHIANAYRLPEVMDGMRVVDVGAHAGFFALECLRRGAARVVACEPWRANAQQARMNLAAWTHACTFHEAAVAGPGVSQVNMRDSYAGATQTGEPHVHPDGVPVPAVSLDDLIVEATGGSGTFYGDGLHERLDLLKIDAEGAEAHLLTAKCLDLVDRVAGEWHSHAGCVPPGEIRAALEAAGFAVELTGEGDGIGMFFGTRPSASPSRPPA